MDKTLEKVKSILSENLGISKETITENSKLSDDLYMDSLDLVEITVLLEENFGKDIPDAAMEKFITVKDIINYLQK